MYVAPKTEFIYIPKYTDTSSWERALELSRENVRKLDKALDETSEALEITAKARDLAGAARDHCAAIADLKEGVINALATEYHIPEKEIIEKKKEVYLNLPDDIKKNMNPDAVERLFNS